MEIKQLKTFITIIKAGSFIEAAKLLGYAQPTVTMQIKSLEEKLNVKLFERLGHQIHLTREGELLVSYAEHILQFATEATSVLSNKNLVADKIVIGASETFGVVRIPDMLKKFRAKFPGVKLNLIFNSVKTIYEQLQNNTVDIAILVTRKLTFPDMTSQILCPEPVVAVVAPDHPFAERKKVDMQDLADQDLLITHEGCTYRAIIDHLLIQENIHPRSLIEVNNVQAIILLAIYGLGIAVLPRVCVERELANHLLCEIPWNGPNFDIFSQVVYHKNKWLSPTLLTFLEEITCSHTTAK
jgi:DNA-binding transcriptional LysR family regulator